MKMHLVKTKIGDYEGFCVLSNSGLSRMVEQIALAKYPITITLGSKVIQFDTLSSFMKCLTLEELKNRTDRLLLDIFGDEPYGHFLDIEDINDET